MSRRPILFVKYYDKGSTIMGGEQIAAALREQGFDAREAYGWDLGGVRDSVLVFIKTSRVDHLVRARWGRNRLVLDVQDTVCFKRRIKNRGLYHGMIFKNRRQLEDFRVEGQMAEVIYHQWDPRYEPHRAGEQELRVAYLGLERSLRLWEKIPGLEFIDHDYFRSALRFNCHLSIREERRDFLYKPNAKVSTAAACRAVLVTTPDESSVELLGADYPYYTEPDLDSIRRTLDKARATLGGPLWSLALARLETVRERTAVGRIAADCAAYCARLG